MEVDTGGVFLVLIDNDAREHALDIVQQAKDASALLEASCQHFDQSVASMSAERVLGEFTDDQLHPLLQATEGFDPVLFRAVLLFELSHVDTDEIDIPELTQVLSTFWKTADHKAADDLEYRFTAPTLKTRYQPFSVMSRYITTKLIGISMQKIAKNTPVAERAERSAEQALRQQIDGKPQKIRLGDVELTHTEHPVFTEQLRSDLSKLFPGPIVRELAARFPEEGTIQDVYPLIEKIQYERANGIIPPAEELLSGYLRNQKKYAEMANRASRTDNMSQEEQLENALSYLLNIHRNPALKSTYHEVYVSAERAWYTVALQESETLPNTYLRRVFVGDIESPDTQEVPLDQRAPIIDAMTRQIRVRAPFGRGQRDSVMSDVFGSF